MLTNTLPRLILRSPTTLCRLAVTVSSLNPGTAHSVQIEPAEWATEIRLKPTLLLGSNSTDDSTAHSPAYFAAGASPPSGVSYGIAWHSTRTLPARDPTPGLEQPRDGGSGDARTIASA